MADQGATAQAKDKAQEVAGQAQEKAQEATAQARDRLREQIDQRSTQAGQQVSGQAADLRSVGEQLRQQGKDQPARLADQAAERVERVGGWLTHSDADRILDDVEDFARRNPWAVVAGGIAAGFVASRFLKASSTERYQARTDGRAALPRRTGEPRFSRDPLAQPEAVEPLAEPVVPPSTSVPPVRPPVSGPGTGGV